jgi:hypothetical protein
MQEHIKVKKGLRKSCIHSCSSVASSPGVALQTAFVCNERVMDPVIVALSVFDKSGQSQHFLQL